MIYGSTAIRRRAILRALLAAVFWKAATPASADREQASELDRAYLILAEVMREIETRAAQHMTRDEIFRGMLRGLPAVVPADHRALVPAAAGLKDDDLLNALDKAIIALQATGVPDLQPVPLISRLLNHCLKMELDRHCEFVSPQMAEKLRERESSLLVGVGITLEESGDGVLRCYPYPGESADLEGVEAGDVLRAVDGREVAGQSRHQVGEWFAGQDGSQVTVRLSNPEGEDREVTMRRRLMRPPLMEVIEDAGGSIIRIRRFQRDTARELQRVLAGLPAGRRLIFDLRGCQGGELDAAIGSVSLFLPKDSHIADIRSRQGVERHQSNTENPYQASRLVLRQDGGTASAAELFIAALLGNPSVNAITEGARSYGKATVQTQIPLEHGGLLTLTTHTVSGPGGMDWESTGIEPQNNLETSESE